MIRVPCHQRMLTAREVSDRLRLPLSTVYFLAGRGALPAQRFGRSLRFPCESINGFGGGERRVLVIDDDAAVRLQARSFLAPEGYAVAEADGMAEGERLARALDFDALLVDLELPDGDGAALIRRLQRLCGRTCIAVLAERGREALLEPVLDLGAALVIRKPLEKVRLLEWVDAVTAGARAPSIREGG